MKEALKNKPAIVYCAINSVNKKKYVGVTSQILKIRMKCHKVHAKSKKNMAYFQYAINKHGFENFNFYTLSKWDNYQDALNEEIRVIALVKPAYNISPGGDGFLGKIMSEQEKEILSKRNIGNKYGLGRKVSEEQKEKFGKKVICLNDGLIFISIKAASIYYKMKRNRITEVCSGVYFTANNLHFSFLNEENKNLTECQRIFLIKEREELKRKNLCKGKPGRKIICIELNKIFNSIAETAEYFKVSASCISIKIKKNKKLHEKFTFEYYLEE